MGPVRALEWIGVLFVAGGVGALVILMLAGAVNWANRQSRRG